MRGRDKHVQVHVHVHDEKSYLVEDFPLVCLVRDAPHKVRRRVRRVQNLQHRAGPVGGGLVDDGRPLGFAPGRARRGGHRGDFLHLHLAVGQEDQVVLRQGDFKLVGQRAAVPRRTQFDRRENSLGHVLELPFGERFLHRRQVEIRREDLRGVSTGAGLRGG